MNARSNQSLRLGMLAIACLLALAASASAGTTDRRDRSERRDAPRDTARAAQTTLPGFVDGRGFVELADPDGQLVEVSLRGRLLKMLTSRAVLRHDEELAEVLGGLECLHAVIAEVGSNREAALERVKSTVSRLEESGWERFVRVREGEGTDLAALMHMRDEEIVDGLVIVGFGDDQVIFVNIAGTIDMERIATLGDLGLPGLDAIPPLSKIDGDESGAAPKTGEEPSESESAQKTERTSHDDNDDKDEKGDDEAEGADDAETKETATEPDGEALAGAPKKEVRP